ncbi:MAG: SRPBCC family protein [Haloarculaceae archaeon]
MAVYERSVVVEAPFDEVWAFHSQESGLEALTPDWMRLRVERTVGPDGDSDPDVLEAGSKVESSIRPFGVGPRQRWISYIAARREGDGEAMFRDEMTRGPFPHWEHTHRFRAVDAGTEVHDRVEYRLPGGPLGRLAAPLGRVGFEPMFRYRHRRTKELLE